jgi:hypothetical protein
MKKQIWTGLAASMALVAVGCGGQASIKSGDVNGVNAKKAKNAVFGQDSALVGIDQNADGIADDVNADGVVNNQDLVFKLSVLFVIASDDATLCDDLTAGTQPDDEQQASILGIRLDNATDAGGFNAGDSLTGDPNNQAALPLILIDTGMAVRQGGADIAISGTKLDATVNITDIGATFSGDAEGSMTDEFSTGADVALGTAVDMKETFKGADDCAALDAGNAAAFAPLLGLSAALQ